MITRIWHGWTVPGNADAYESLLTRQVLPDIAAMDIPGYRGVEVLRRELDTETEFVTILKFDSLEAIREFVGDDCEVAHVPAAARELLSRFDERTRHYQVRLLDMH